jgi:hypothetical protein
MDGYFTSEHGMVRCSSLLTVSYTTYLLLWNVQTTTPIATQGVLLGSVRIRAIAERAIAAWSPDVRRERQTPQQGATFWALHHPDLFAREARVPLGRRLEALAIEAHRHLDHTLSSSWVPPRLGIRGRWRLGPRPCVRGRIPAGQPAGVLCATVHVCNVFGVL